MLVGARAAVLASRAMAATGAPPCVLLVDDNQSFSAQVTAAFAETGVDCRAYARGDEVLGLLEQGLLRPDLLIVDLVRPASAGRWLVEQLFDPARASAQRRARGQALLPPPVLALAPVTGSYLDLPEGVEIQVKPIFPAQLVASAQRVLGFGRPHLPGVSVPPAASGPLRRGEIEHRLPPSDALPALDPDDSPTGRRVSPTLRGTGAIPAAPRPPADPGRTDDEYERLDLLEEDDSDFGPADTLLAPRNLTDLARALASGAPDDAARALAAHVRQRMDVSDATTPVRIEVGLRAQSAELSPAEIGSDDSLDSAYPIDVSDTTDVPGQGRAGRPAPAAASPAAASATAPPEPAGDQAALAGQFDQAALAGRLDVVSLLDVIALLSRQQQTGVLTVVAPSRRADITLRDGRIELCTASGFTGLRFGRFALELTGLRPSQLDDLAADPAEPERTPTGEDLPSALLGLRLCRAGLLTRAELNQALARQTAELIYEALRLQGGRFTFVRTRELPRAAVDPELGGGLGLDAEAVLLEGYRRAADWLQIDRDAADGAFYVAAALSENDLIRLGLNSKELTILSLCNGRLSTGDVARESRLPLLEVVRTLQRLEALRLARRRLPAVLAS